MVPFQSPSFLPKNRTRRRSVNTSALNNARGPLSSLEDTVDLQDFLGMKEKKWHLTSAGWIKSVLLEMCHWIDWKIYVLPVSYIQFEGVIWGGPTLIRRKSLNSFKHLVFQNNLAYKRVNVSSGGIGGSYTVCQCYSYRMQHLFRVSLCSLCLISTNLKLVKVLLTSGCSSP